MTQAVDTSGRRPGNAPASMRLIDNFLPPEGVPLRFEVAGLGTRFGAQIIDILITLGLCIAIIAVLALSRIVVGLGLTALAALLFFFIRTPYYAAAELVWNGQTLGKRLSRIRVISGDGRSLTPHQIVVRNLMREVEVFVPGTLLLFASDLGWFGASALLGWIAILIAVPLLNRRRQRLGDIIANTYVICQPTALLMPDLSVKAMRTVETERGRFSFLPNQLDHYGAFELQVLEKVLQAGPESRTQTQARRRANLAAIGERIRRKIDFSEPVNDNDEEAFLTAFYAAQRAYLEQKQLFGEVREDKHHRKEEPPS